MEIEDLHIMIRTGNRSGVARLIRHNTCLLQERCSQGWTALIVAAHAGKADIIEMLIAAGADPNAPNPKGTTPLMFGKGHFLGTGDATPMQVLLSHGADSEARDLRGLTLLDYVADDRKEEVATILGSTHWKRSPA